MSEWFGVLVLQPLMVIYRAIYDFPGGLETGVKVMVFSITLNLLLVPVYRQMEEKARNSKEKRGRMLKEVARMKENFRGRERYFYIRAVHRQYRYHPIQVLFSSNELFLQMLVFASVFYFLSESGVLNGMMFGRIADLGRPDELLFGINLLPFLMTAINVVSLFYYTKDRDKKIQGIVLALFFLLLLYASPSGLVLYWTINNFWSLLRNMSWKKAK